LAEIQGILKLHTCQGARLEVKNGAVHGEISARLYSDGKPIRLRWEDGLITECEELASLPTESEWLAPSLVDPQINGFAGVDFQKDALSESELTAAADGLEKAGCGRFLLTLMTDEWSKMLARLKHLRVLRAGSRRLRRAIAGWHLEGPFLSAAPGFCGAHNPEVMRDSSPEKIRELRELTETDVVLLTVAPEREHALESIELAGALGMKVSLGHTDASARVLQAAVRAGAKGFTHLGNACPQLLDRHDNIVWRVLDTTGMVVSLIPDQIHVSPSFFRLVHRVLPEDSIYYTTDAISAAGASPGRYQVGRFHVEVGADRVVRQPGKTNYAGSSLRPIEGVFFAADMLGRPWQEVWDFLSIRPAHFIGLEAGLAVGRPAHFCWLQFSDGKKLPAVRTFTDGIEGGEARTG
jgi:N-acetylglucosamine-6-phosphate deacetylase